MPPERVFPIFFLLPEIAAFRFAADFSDISHSCSYSQVAFSSFYSRSREGEQKRKITNTFGINPATLGEEEKSSVASDSARNSYRFLAYARIPANLFVHEHRFAARFVIVRAFKCRAILDSRYYTRALKQTTLKRTSSDD